MSIGVCTRVRSSLHVSIRVYEYTSHTYTSVNVHVPEVSKISGRLVAPIMNTLLVLSMPSISVKI